MEKENPGSRTGNRRVVLIGAMAIVLIAAVQFLLLFTVGNERLKPLDPQGEFQLQVTRVLDLDFPDLGEERFMAYLDRLRIAIKERIGYRVSFSVRKTILIDNFLAADDPVFDTGVARSWFRNQHSAIEDWQTNFRWLADLLDIPENLQVLAAHYGLRDRERLEGAVRVDFLERAARHLAITNLRGEPVFIGGRKLQSAASVFWAFLIANQSRSDLVIANGPVFFPSVQTPVDAVTRGGLVLTMLERSERPIQGSLAVSLYPLLAAPFSDETKRDDFLVQMSLQGFARLFLRRDLQTGDPASLLYPVFGDAYEEWHGSGNRGLATNAGSLLETF
jgi:hypothetical protein